MASAELIDVVIRLAGGSGGGDKTLWFSCSAKGNKEALEALGLTSAIPVRKERVMRIATGPEIEPNVEVVSGGAYTETVTGRARLSLVAPGGDSATVDALNRLFPVGTRCYVSRERLLNGRPAAAAPATAKRSRMFVDDEAGE